MPEKDMERFEAPPSEQVTTFETDELTALCPFDFGGPDHYTLVIKYEPADYCLESRSLKQRLESYRDEEITAERLADALYRAIEDAIVPERLYIRLEQARRGGIEETVEVGDRALC
ncbi:7-cyano-7-deazaguanine reductase [Natronomonas halophila]|uniref:7-cyano-7-deazaguanine reductase n=1 Tax=Natronomonas halophila TaxID=2747817 RepID=UPI0015B49519|nr:7-cyano-7-deazaguanine reductase [Natronomonas halophila]QLD86957.1 7-cyano-7-deazaguanine reductase [Natronomonas halophila]